jgi:hypothetical protein
MHGMNPLTQTKGEAVDNAVDEIIELEKMLESLEDAVNDVTDATDHPCICDGCTYGTLGYLLYVREERTKQLQLALRRIKTLTSLAESYAPELEKALAALNDSPRDGELTPNDA